MTEKEEKEKEKDIRYMYKLARILKELQGGKNGQEVE